jgi:hypothetical protein
LLSGLLRRSETGPCVTGAPQRSLDLLQSALRRGHRSQCGDTFALEGGTGAGRQPQELAGIKLCDAVDEASKGSLQLDFEEELLGEQ